MRGKGDSWGAFCGGGGQGEERMVQGIAQVQAEVTCAGRWERPGLSSCPVGEPGKGRSCWEPENVGRQVGVYLGTDASFTLSFVQLATHAPQHLQGWLGEEHEVSVQGQDSTVRGAGWGRGGP